jgi:hypothetical protein
MTREEKLLIALFKIDAEYCAKVKQVNEEAVSAAESGRRLRSCTECGRLFTPEHPASRFCGKSCLATRERRKYRDRIGAPR